MYLILKIIVCPGNSLHLEKSGRNMGEKMQMAVSLGVGNRVFPKMTEKNLEETFSVQ